MNTVPMNPANAVAMNTPPAGIPVTDRTVGLTAKMYAIAKNVVKPARISLLAVVLFSSSLNRSFMR